MTGVLPLALGAAAVLLAVVWALRSAGKVAERVSDEESAQPLPALPAMLRSEEPPPLPDAARRDAPLVPIAGLDGGGASEGEGTLAALIGIPERISANDAPTPTGAASLPRLDSVSASPFEGSGVDLGVPSETPRRRAEPTSSAPTAAASSGLNAATGSLAIGCAAGACGAGLGLGASSAALGGLGLAACLYGVARTLASNVAAAAQPRFEEDLALALVRLGGLLGRGLRPEEALKELRREFTEGPLADELDRSIAGWTDEANRPAAFAAARDRRGAEWGRVLFALDEAARTGSDPRRLLAHTAEGLQARRSDGLAGAEPDGGAAIAIAAGLSAIAAAIAIAV